jgi:hypothetical protein
MVRAAKYFYEAHTSVLQQNDGFSKMGNAMQARARANDSDGACDEVRKRRCTGLRIRRICELLIGGVRLRLETEAGRGAGCGAMSDAAVGGALFGPCGILKKAVIRLAMPT